MSGDFDSVLSKNNKKIFQFYCKEHIALAF